MEVMGLMLGEFVDEYTVSPFFKHDESRGLELTVLERVGARGGCVCDASVRNLGHRRIGRPRLSNENARHAEADWKVSSSVHLIKREPS